MATIYLQDTFTDTDATLLTAHTMDTGGGWTQTAGSAYTITSNKAGNATVLGNWYMASADAGQTDVSVSADLTTASTAGSTTFAPAVLGRFTDANNHYKLYIDSFSQTLILADVVAGAFTARASGAVTLAQLTTYNVKLIMRGTLIQGFVDGVQKLAFTDVSGLSGTRCGIGEYRDPTATSYNNPNQFDNFLTTDPPPFPGGNLLMMGV